MPAALRRYVRSWTTKPLNDTGTSYAAIELNFRRSYGKLYASLTTFFGASYIDIIEDSIQNTFYKALKSWKPGQYPRHIERWLFITARNDVINQIKHRYREVSLGEPGPALFVGDTEGSIVPEDSRLTTLYFCLRLSRLKRVSQVPQVIFILKNVCGFSVREISACLLMGEEAVYKNLQRITNILKDYAGNDLKKIVTRAGAAEEVGAMETIVYAIFTMGYDTFNKNINRPVNEEVCLEAVSLARLLEKQFGHVTTRNLLALFCFHLARTPARFKEDRLVAFFDQDPSDWDHTLLTAGFHYLEKPAVLNRYYLEALIASIHMTTPHFTPAHWEKVVRCYDALLTICDTPMIRMNRAYCLARANRDAEALQELKSLAVEIPVDHVYYSLMMGQLLKIDDPETSDKWIKKALFKTDQPFRQAHIRKLMED